MRVTSKGQVTIPQHIRAKHGFGPHSDIAFVEDDGRVYLEVREEADPYAAVRGTADSGMSTEEIMALTRGDEGASER